MATAKKRIPPEDVIHEDSGPDKVEIDVDDAQIQEPKDDAFKKSPQPARPSKQRRKKA
jgi:hypothetical protein